MHESCSLPQKRSDLVFSYGSSGEFQSQASIVPGLGAKASSSNVSTQTESRALVAPGMLRETPLRTHVFSPFFFWHAPIFLRSPLFVCLFVQQVCELLTHSATAHTVSYLAHLRFLHAADRR